MKKEEIKELKNQLINLRKDYLEKLKVNEESTLEDIYDYDDFYKVLESIDNIVDYFYERRLVKPTKFIYLIWQVYSNGQEDIVDNKIYTNQQEAIKEAKYLTYHENKCAMDQKESFRKKVITEVRQYELREKVNLKNHDEVIEYCCTLSGYDTPYVKEHYCY